MNQDILQKRNSGQRLREFLTENPESEYFLQILSIKERSWNWEIDVMDRFIFVSAREKVILGYGNIELIGKTPYDIMPEKEAQEFFKMFEYYKRLKKAFWDQDCCFIHRSGRVISFKSAAVPIINTSYELLGYRGMTYE